MPLNLNTVAAAALFTVVANGCLADPYSEMIVSLNPIGYWRLGESAGTTAVDEMGVSNGIYTNLPMLGEAGAVAGDTAIKFDGSNDYIEIPHNDAYLLDVGAVSLWFKMDFSGPPQGLFSKDSKTFDTGGHLTITQKGSHVEALIDSTSVSYVLLSSDFTITNWNHLLVTFGPGGFELYINGQLEASDAYTGGLGTSSGGVGNYEPIVIGASTSNSEDLSTTPLQKYFEGWIDEVAIFGFQPTPSQISDLSSRTDTIRVVQWHTEPPISSN